MARNHARQRHVHSSQFSAPIHLAVHGGICAAEAFLRRTLHRAMASTAMRRPSRMALQQRGPWELGEGLFAGEEGEPVGPTPRLVVRRFVDGRFAASPGARGASPAGRRIRPASPEPRGLQAFTAALPVRRQETGVREGGRPRQPWLMPQARNAAASCSPAAAVRRVVPG